MIALPSKPYRAPDILWKIAAALALLATGYSAAWLLRTPPKNEVVTLRPDIHVKSPEERTSIPPRPRHVPVVPPVIDSAKPALLVSTTTIADGAATQDKVLSTGSHKRSVHRLADESLLWLDENTRVSIVRDREVKLDAGRAYVEVARRVDAAGNRVPFVMQTPRGPVTALGTKFAVNVSGSANEILVTEGKVSAPGLPQAIVAGQWWHGANI